jgi:hypothetical protein
MKYLILPIIKFIFALICTLIFLFYCFPIMFILNLVWNFKITKWSDVVNNEGSFNYRFKYFTHVDYEADITPIKTFIRFYNFDLY